jgi:methionine-rich copper-binding protein CopC
MSNVRDRREVRSVVARGKWSAPVRRVVVIALLGALGVWMQAPSAHAHALLRSSEPAAGARLDQAPESVSITWSEEPEKTLSRIEVLDAT